MLPYRDLLANKSLNLEYKADDETDESSIAVMLTDEFYLNPF